MYEARDMWGQPGKKLGIRGRRWDVIRITNIEIRFIFIGSILFFGLVSIKRL